MAKNDGKHWSQAEVSQLRSLVRGNTPTRVIGIKMGRTPEAVQSKASEQKISLDPHNRLPYGTKKK